MANRLLTVSDMQRLCDSVGPGFTVVPQGASNVFPIVRLKGLSWEVRTADMITEDADFIAIGPRRMWGECYRSVGEIDIEIKNLTESSDRIIKDMEIGDLKKPSQAYRVPRPEDVRGETHGDYGEMAQLIQFLKTNMRCGSSWGRMNPMQQEALELIATKIGRIVCGDPGHRDHWDDIRGYAQLVLERIRSKV